MSADDEHTGNWMLPQEAERLANLWCAGQPLDDLPQWRTAMHVLMRELRCVRADADRLRQENESLRADAERWQWGVKHAAWHRSEERAHIAIPVAANADLSCVAMRVAAIDSARKAPHTKD